MPKNVHLHINVIFIIISITFLFGVGITAIVLNFSQAVIISACMLVFFFNIFFYTKKYVLLFFLAYISCLLGIFLTQNHLDLIYQKQDFLHQYNNTFIYSYGLITDTYKVGDYEREYEIMLGGENKQTDTTYRIPEGEITGLITIPSNFDVDKGDIISFGEKIITIENFSPGFNYQKYMWSQKYFFTIDAKSINIIGKKEPYFIIDKIDTLREVLLGKIQKLYPEEEAIFLGGILLGARENLPQDLKDDFNASGLTHFIAVSGFNITILVVFLSVICKFFPPLIQVIIITVSIAGFTLLVGDAAPVIRAAIMGLLAYYIMLSGRQVHHFSLLLLVAVIMVLFSPLILVYDVSFHLSFLAVLGILYTQKFFKKIFFFLPEFLAIREAFVLTLSALAFALPVMIFNFGQLSLLAPFANMAVTWTIPIAMLFGFISILIDFISPTGGLWTAYFTWIFLAWDIKVVHFFGGLDWAILKTDFGIYRHTFQILYFSVLIFVINYFTEE